MSFEHYERFFTLFAAGLGLLLAGGLNLVLGTSGRRVWLRVTATLILCGAVVGGLSVLTRPELALLAGGVVFGVLAGAALLGSEWLARRVAAVVAFFREPAPRWGLVAVGGLAVLLGSGLAFDRIDERLTEQSMRSLELALGRSPSQPNEQVPVATDRGTRIVVKEPTTARDPDELAEPEASALRDARVQDQSIRRGGATDQSNCHGWVFTGGKYLLSPDDVEAILKDNGYHETHETHPGDLVIYRQGGAIAHSAVVRYVTEGQPVLVEGKWGGMGVFLHPADRSLYGTEYTFYRSTRVGHLLVGLGGSPGPAPEAAPATQVTE